jgi:hypothetical protein
LYFVELKAPGKKPRPIQVKRMEQFEALGFSVYVLGSVAAVETFINDVKGGDA